MAQRPESIRGTDRQMHRWRLRVISQEFNLPSDRDYVHLSFETNASVWIASSQGLDRFDGYEWSHFNSKDGLPSDFIRCTLRDRQGRLWVGTDHGAGVFDPKARRFERLPSGVGPDASSVRRIVEDSEGGIWFCSDSFGGDTRGRLDVLRQGQWLQLAPPWAKGDLEYHNVMVEADGRALVLTASGMLALESGVWSSPLAGLAPKSVEAFWTAAPLPDGRIAVSANSGLYFGQNGSWRHADAPATWPPYNLCPLPDGRLLTFGRETPRSHHSLLQWRGGRFESVSLGVFHMHEWIESVERAPDDSVWAVGANFIVRAEEDLDGWIEQTGNAVPAFTVGKVSWFTNAGEVFQMAGGTWRSQSNPGLTYTVDRQQRVWGWNTNRAVLVDSVPSREYRAGELGLGEIRGFCADAGGEVWLYGLSPEGLPCGVYLSTNGLRRLAMAECSTNTFPHVRPDHEHGIWMLGKPVSGTGLALFRLSGLNEPARPGDSERIESPVFGGEFPELYVDRTGAIWLFRKGLIWSRPAQQPGQWRRLRGALGNTFSGIVENRSGLWTVCHGERGGLWGLGHFDGKEWSYPYRDRVSYPYTLQDGTLAFGARYNIVVVEDEVGAQLRLLPLPVEGNLVGALKDERGQWWVGVDDMIFRSTDHRAEARMVVELAPPQTTRGDLYQARLRPVVRFSNVVPAQRYRMMYSLSGLSKVGVQEAVGGLVKIPTDTLAPGPYEVAVDLQSIDGVQTLSSIALKFRVAAIPLQQRPFFWPVLGLLFCLVLSLSAYSVFTRRRIARYAEVLEDRVRERTLQLEQDIQERRQAEEKLRLSEEQLRSVITSTPVVLYVIDEEGKFVFSEGKGLASLGLRPGQVVGTSVFELYRDYPEVVAGIRAGLQGRPMVLEFRLGELVFETCLSPFHKPDGTLGGLIGVSLDVTERHRADHQKHQLQDQLRQAQKMEAIGLLAGGVAHDFNNLLQVILGNAQLALESSGSAADVETYVHEILQSAQKASSLTRQLLAFGRRQILQRQDTNLGLLANDMLQLVRRVVGPTIEVAYVADPAPANVRVDRSQMEQVMMNLCLNSRDAMPEGGRIDVEVHNVRFASAEKAVPEWAREGEFVRLAVADHGVGMSPEVLSRIFEPFFSTKPKHRGTGLGLAVVFGIVQQHEGFLHVTSEPGKGARFEIYLPVLPQAPTVVEPAEKKRLSGGSETILIAEDEPGVRAFGRRVLERAGYDVLVAVDGQEAVEVFRQHQDRIDLVILDAIMPRMGGRQAQAAIASLKPSVPVLFVSGYNAASLEEGQSPPKESPWLEKPYSAEVLLAKIREVLDSTPPS